jgi:hypothetical protein
LLNTSLNNVQQARDDKFAVFSYSASAFTLLVNEIRELCLAFYSSAKLPNNVAITCGEPRGATRPLADSLLSSAAAYKLRPSRRRPALDSDVT